METPTPQSDPNEKAHLLWPDATELENSVFTTGLRLAQAQIGELNERYQANHDELTGQYNRRGFINQSISLLEAAEPTDKFVLLLADVNSFKEVNDRLGHERGDTFLTSLGECFQASLPQSVVGRFGGDEFAVLHLLGSDSARDIDEGQKEIKELVERLKSSCDEHFASTPDLEKLGVGVSIGSSAAQPGQPAEPNKALDEMLRQADDAMYALKPDRLSWVRDRD